MCSRLATGGTTLERREIRETPLAYGVVAGMLRPVVEVLLHPRIEGVDNMPSTGPAILCSNHLSMVDPVVMALNVPRTVYFLAKNEYFAHRYRWFFESLGVMPVARQGGQAGESSLARGAQVLEAGAVLGLYPEGTRSPDGRLYRGKTGAARLAIRTGAPIVPIAVIGSRDVLPPHGRLPRRAPVAIRFGAPIDLAHLRGRDHEGSVLRQATDALMGRIAELSGQEYADVYAAQARAAQATRRPVHHFDRLRPDDDSLTLDDPRSR